MANEKLTMLPRSSSTQPCMYMYMYMSSLTHQTLYAGRTGIWCTCTNIILMDHAHLNVPIHLTVNGICHVKGTLWWFSKIDEATELMDSPDHRLWSTLTEVCRSFRPYLGVTSPPLSVGIRWVECRSRRDLTLSSSASSLSILDVSVVMVLTETERDTCTIEVGRAEKERMEGDIRNWSQHHKNYQQ